MVKRLRMRKHSSSARRRGFCTLVLHFRVSPGVALVLDMKYSIFGVHGSRMVAHIEKELIDSASLHS